MATKVKVVQEKNKPVPTEVIAASIKDIADGVKKMRAGRLNDTAIVYLVHRASGVAMNDVRKVINGMESLEREYLK